MASLHHQTTAARLAGSYGSPPRAGPVPVPDPVNVSPTYREEEIAWLELPASVPFRLGVVQSSEVGPIYLLRELVGDSFKEVMGTMSEIFAVSTAVINHSRIIDSLAAGLAAVNYPAMPDARQTG